MLFTGPEGNLLVEMVGEGHGQNMMQFVQHAIEHYSEKQQLNKAEIGKPFVLLLDLIRYFLPDTVAMLRRSVVAYHFSCVIMS